MIVPSGFQHFLRCFLLRRSIGWRMLALVLAVRIFACDFVLADSEGVAGSQKQTESVTRIEDEKYRIRDEVQRLMQQKIAQPARNKVASPPPSIITSPAPVSTLSQAPVPPPPSLKHAEDSATIKVMVNQMVNETYNKRPLPNPALMVPVPTLEARPMALTEPTQLISDSAHVTAALAPAPQATEAVAPSRDVPVSPKTDSAVAAQVSSDLPPAKPEVKAAEIAPSPPPVQPPVVDEEKPAIAAPSMPGKADSVLPKMEEAAAAPSPSVPASPVPVPEPVAPPPALQPESTAVVVQAKEKPQAVDSSPVVDAAKSAPATLPDPAPQNAVAVAAASVAPEAKPPDAASLAPPQTKNEKNVLSAREEAPASSSKKAESSKAKPVAEKKEKTPKETTAKNPQNASTQELIDEGDDATDIAFLKNLAGSDQVLALNLAGVAGGSTLDEPVGLSESVAFSLRNNFEIQAGEEKTRSAYWDKLGAYSEYAPSVQFDYLQGAERSRPASYNDSFGNRVLNSTHFRRDRDLTVRQPLIDLGIIADILSSEDKENQVKSDQRDAREGIASDTVGVYLKLLQARIAIHLADQYKTYLDNLSERMTARVDGGGGTNADLERIKSRSAAAENAHIEAIGEYETDVSEYRRLTKVIPSQIMIPDFLAPSVPPDMQSALEMAYKANPAYRSSLYKIDEASDDRNKTISTLMPKLSVQYSKQFTYDGGGAAKGNPVDGVYPDQTTDAVMLVAQWSLNGGTAIAGGISSLAKEREMDLRSQDLRSRMEQGIRSSYTALRAARERRDALRRSVAANEQVVKGFEEQFKFGTRSLFDLLDSYEQLYSSRLNLMRIVVANAQASYQVHRQMGDLVPTIISEEKN